METGEPFQSFLNLPQAGRHVQPGSPRDLSKIGEMPCQFLESLTNVLFILLSAKACKQVFAGQIILGYRAEYLGDYLWLSALLSHTSNSVPLRAGICWPCYLRLERTWPKEKISKTGRARASQWP